jgi:RNA polymerase sigma factor (sigma-70 family)
MSQIVLESTQNLVHLACTGDERAKCRLMDRCLPPLQRWARGRLPHYARSLADTDDLVQGTLVRTLQRLDAIDVRGTGSFLAYLRQCLLNAVRDEVRRASRWPQHAAGETTLEISAPLSDPAAMLDYERALSLLPEPKREAVILRIEFGMTFAEVAAELEMPSADAARMMVSRALIELAGNM